jgi:hypothetical protein
LSAAFIYHILLETIPPTPELTYIDVLEYYMSTASPGLYVPGCRSSRLAYDVVGRGREELEHGRDAAK